MEKTHAPFTRRRFLGQLAAGVGLAATCPAILSAAPKTYTNPVYAGSMPDPFVLTSSKVPSAFWRRRTGAAPRKLSGWQ